MEIRQAHISEIQTIADLWLKMVIEINPERTPNKNWWMEDAVRLINKPERYLIYVLLEDYRIVGFVDFQFIRNAHTGKREMFAPCYYILPQYRGTKVTRKALKEIIDKVAIERGYKGFSALVEKSRLDIWEKFGANITDYKIEISIGG